MHAMGEGTERVSVARRLWSPPARFADRPTDRRVTFLELFFDLVFVVVISHPGRRLAAHPSWSGVGRFVFLFYTVSSSWINGTPATNRCRRGPSREREGDVGAGSAEFRRPDQIDPIVTADTILTVSPEGMAAEPGRVDGLPVVCEFDPGSFVLTAFGRANAGTFRRDRDLSDRFLRLFLRI
jgi:hypothetical protein